MPWIDTHVVSQGKYLFPDPHDQPVVIAARKVGAAYGAVKKGVPRENDTRCV